MKIQDFEWKKNAPLLLFVLNLVLLAGVFVAYDPFDLFSQGYESSPRVLGSSPEAIQRIEIVPPPGSRRQVLERNHGEGEKTESEWKLTLLNQKRGQDPGGKHPDRNSSGPGDEAMEYPGDEERIQELIEQLTGLRKYYSIENSNKNQMRYGLRTTGSGECLCNRVVVTERSGKKTSIDIGSSSAVRNETMIRVTGEDRIYSVQGNLIRTTGAGENDYFRNREFFSPGQRPQISEVVSLRGKMQGRPSLLISRTGDQWMMVEPASSPVKKEEFESLIKEIFQWRIDRFFSEPPQKLDRSRSLVLEIDVRKSPNDTRKLKLEILGETDFGSYVVRLEDGQLVEVSSFSLENIFQPEKKLMESRAQPGFLPGALQ